MRVHMIESAKKLLHQLIELPATERAILADELLESLDRPDTALDAAWLQEAEARRGAHRRGALGAVDASQVFEGLGLRR